MRATSRARRADRDWQRTLTRRRATWRSRKKRLPACSREAPESRTLTSYPGRTRSIRFKKIQECPRTRRRRQASRLSKYWSFAKTNCLPRRLCDPCACFAGLVLAVLPAQPRLPLPRPIRRRLRRRSRKRSRAWGAPHAPHCHAVNAASATIRACGLNKGKYRERLNGPPAQITTTSPSGA